MLEKAAIDIVRAAQRGGETVLKEAWSRLDAAAQKPRPSDYLGPRAIRSIQGRGEDSS